MKIYFYTPEFFSGGTKMIYRHAEILTSHGFSAFVLHTKNGFINKAFRHAAPVRYWKDIHITPEDIIVIPEYLAIWTNPEVNPHGVKGFLKRKFSANRFRYLAYQAIHSQAKIVLYNQNPFYTFFDYPIKPHHLRYPYLLPNCIGAVCVSQNNFEYLKLAFPELPIFRIYYSIDAELFKPVTKKKQVGYLTFKNQKEVAQVVNLLLLRGNLKGYQLVPISGTEEEVAARFNESAVVLNFGNIEGFGLPPAEAMLSGCVVIGYHGEGGREFMLPEHAFPIAHGDIISFVKTTEAVLAALVTDDQSFNALTTTAREFIGKNYSKEKEEATVVSAWRNLLAKTAGL
ncbi:MAG: hypothetical protein J0L66_12710 [Cytophagales bacterium]|nr:hypothetical protein [Cytophagales bacterium]